MKSLLEESSEAIRCGEFPRARQMILTRQKFVDDCHNPGTTAVCNFEEFRQTGDLPRLQIAIHNAEVSLRINPVQIAMHALLGQAYATLGRKYVAWYHYCDALKLARQAGQQKEAERILFLQGRIEDALY